MRTRSGTICRLFWCSALLFGALSTGFLACGEDRHELGSLQAPDPDLGDGFGQSIAHYGDYLVVGAPGTDDFRDKERVGDVYLYRFDGTNPELIKHFPGPIDPTDRRFGLSVALGDGLLAIAGDAYRTTTDRPIEFFIYERDEPSAGMWGLSFTVKTTGDAIGDEHLQVKIHNGLVIGSIPGFRRLVLARKIAGSWTTTEIQEQPQDSIITGFGGSFDVDDLGIAVGARSDRAENGNRGAVQLYKGNGFSWFESERLRPPVADAPWYGQQVALAGSRLAVRDVSGVVFLYRDGGAGWNHIATLDRHRSVSADLEDDELLIGIPQLLADPATLNRSGGAHLHRFSEIEEGKSMEPLVRLVPSEPVNGHRLGGTVLLSKQWAFVSTEISQHDPGTLYWFDRSLQPVVSYSDWRDELLQRGLSHNQSAPDSVLNSFEIPNAICFAMGIDPVRPSSNDIPQWKWSETHRAQVFEFRRSRYVGGVSLKLESSADLKTWQLADPQRILESSTSNGHLMAFHLPWWIPGATGYLRLRATFDN